MAKIKFPLKQGDKGKAVAALQDGLQQLLERRLIPLADDDRRRAAADLAKEREKSNFGATTARLVGAFQAEYKLEAGPVDEATALALDAAIVSATPSPPPPSPPSPPPPPPPPPRVFNTPLHEGAGGADVALAHDLLAGFGFIVAPPELRDRLFGPSTAAAVRSWQKQVRLAETGALDLDSLARLAEEGRKLPRLVSGAVRLADGTAAPGLRVVAFDRDFRAEQTLGEAVTGRDGRYRIGYTAEACARAEKGAADLGVKVYSAGAKYELLYQSGTQELAMNAPREAVIDVIVELPEGALQTEFERIAQELRPLIGDVRFPDIAQEAGSDEGDFLALETGISVDRIAHFVVAYRLAGLADLRPDYFYALLREDGLFGVGPDRPRLVQLPVGFASDSRAVLLEAALLDEALAAAAVRRAVRKRLVPASLESEVARIRKALERWRGEAEAYGRESVPRRILGLVDGLIEDGKVEEMLRFLTTFDPAHVRDLHQALEGRGLLRGDAAEKAASRLKLGELLGFNLGLVDEVAEGFGVKGPEDVRALARLERKDWTDVIARGTARVNLGGRPIEAAQARRQSSVIVRRFEKAFPTTAFTAQLARGKPRSIPEHRGIVQLMEAHPDLELDKHKLAPFLEAAGADPAAVAPEVMRGVEKVQRIFQLAGDYRKTEGLLGAGYSAAADVVDAGRSRFVADAKRFAGMSDEEAETAFRTAESTNLAAVMVATNLRTLSWPTALEGASAAALSKTIGKILANQPDLESLFGANDACECVHCRSIYSPAAYFADVMRFLRNRLVRDTSVSPSPPSTKSAKDELFKRRPDLGEIDLNCDNAHIEVPHIDIVCELAEEAVAPDQGFTFTGAIADGAAPPPLLAAVRTAGYKIGDDALVYGPYVPDRFILRDKGIAVAIDGPGPVWRLRRLRQTHGTSEERAASPEYVNPDAYAALKAGRAAFELPFDLDHLETSAFLAAAGTDRAALMTALAVPLSPPAEAIAGDSLGLSPGERGAIFAPQAAHQAEIWGVPGPVATAAMARLDTFTRRTGLEYREVERLISGAYVRSGADLFIRHLDNGCNLAAKEIVNLDDNVLDRMHRVLRLGRKIGIDPGDVDRFASGPRLGKGDLDDPALLALARLKSLAKDLGVGIERLITWLDTIPHQGERSAHALLFQNKAATGPLDPRLAPEDIVANEAAETATPGSGLKLGLFEADLALAFGARAGDLALLIGRLNDSALLGANPPLTFRALAALYGRLGLARALKLKAEDLVRLERLLGMDPLADPVTLGDFVATARAIAATGVRIKELAFRLAPGAADLAVPELADAAVDQALDGMDKALLDAAIANRSPFDAALATLEQVAALETLLQRQPELSVADIAALADLVRLAAPDSAAGAKAKAVVSGQLGALVDVPQVAAAVDAIVAAAPGGGAALESARAAMLALVMDEVSATAMRIAAVEAGVAATAALLRVSPDLTATILRGRLQIGGVGHPLVDVLVAGSLATPSGSPPSWTPAQSQTDRRRAGRLAFAIARLIAPFDPNPTTIAFLFDHAAALGWLALDAVPFEAGVAAIAVADWLELADLMALVAEFPPVRVPGQADATLDPLAVFQLTLAPAPDNQAVLDALATVTGWPRDLLGNVDTRLALALADYRTPATWRRVGRAVALVHSLALPLTDAVALAQETLGDAERRLALAMLRARYSDADWLGALKAIMDPIRERKRDALIAYLIAANPGLSKPDLYDHFLTDTEWSPKMPSSRLVHAHGTLQLFIQRCIAGLEPKATADLEGDLDWKWWDWMRNYRVWEVNRKVFTEAQYYIRPEWRDDKTEPFVDMEKALLQNEINQENIEAAFEGYLDRLDEIAFLDVLATCYDFSREELHVFCRTKGGDPRQYFHRALQRERLWTPLTKVDVGVSGEHLIAFFRNNRLCLAWATFLEKGDEEQTATYPSPSSDLRSLKADRFTEIKLAISEYTGKKWLPARTSDGHLETPKRRNTLDRTLVTLAVTPGTDRFTVDVYFDDPEGRMNLGSFLLSGCKGYPEPIADSSYGWLFLPQFEETSLKAQRFVEDLPRRGDALAILTGLSGGGFDPLFGRTPDRFRVSYPLQASELDRFISAIFGGVGYRRYHPTLFGMFMPFFFEDNVHGYMLVPGCYGEFEERSGTYRTQKTFSNIRRLFLDIVALVTKYLRLLNEAPNPVAQEKVLAELAADPELGRILEEIASYRETRFGLVVRNFYHPLSCFLRERFFEGGIPRLLARDTQLMTGPFRFDNATTGYAPAPIILPPYPVEELEFGRDSAYGANNWELTFHAPHLIASKLIEAERFDEAELWLRYIFDPLGSSNDPPPKRHWNTKPFYDRDPAEYGGQLVTAIMDRIARDPAGAIETELADAVLDWRRNPFKPYLVARSRTVVFQQAIVDLTIRTFIGRGDQFFRRDQLEDLVMASLDYSRAERLLGPRPKIVPPAVPPPPETYNQLEAKLDLFGNALRKLENLLPDPSTLPHGGAELPPPPLSLESLYFCVPPSEKLFQLWDLLEERQFNLRNSRTIDGVERTLSLFAPPLSVEELIKASAAGLSVSAILAGMSAPQPAYRFRVMLRHAIELADVAAGFGREMEQALTSTDGEGLSRLKATQQMRLLSEQTASLQEEIRAAGLATESAKRGRKIHQENQAFYAGRPYMNAWEVAANVSYGISFALQAVMAIGYIAAGGLALIPKFMIGAAGFGGSPTGNVQIGGDQISQGARDAMVGAINALAGAADKAGSMFEHQANYQLRKEDWDHSAKLAELEMQRADVEIAMAGIRERIAKEQLRMNGVQQQQAAAEETYLRSKFTNRELFEWLGQELRSLSRQMFNLAFEAAKAAERCFNYELGLTESFIRPGGWNDTRRGLLAASNLTADIRKMDSAYLKRNVRERELTKHLSLSRLDPVALLELRTTGKCVIQVPEAVFDLEHPGHYFRRIRSLSVTVPCVVGPYGSVPLKLTQTSNRIRVETTASANADSYAEDPGNDPRFRYNVGRIQSISTSRGDDDAGLFSADLNDERYLPFEGSGLCGTFLAELPRTVRPFDYGSISDVVLNLRYTARDGGGGFRAMVEAGLEGRLNAMALGASRSGLFQAIDLRRDRPDVWHRLTTAGAAELTIGVDDFPYYTGARLDQIVGARMIARIKGAPASYAITVDQTPPPNPATAVTLSAAAEPGLSGLLASSISGLAVGAPLTITTPLPSKIDELLLVVNYSII